MHSKGRELSHRIEKYKVSQLPGISASMVMMTVPSDKQSEGIIVSLIRTMMAK